MPTVFIANMAITLPSRFAPGDIATEAAADMLNYVQLTRIKSRLRYMLAQGHVLADGLQAKAAELAEQELVPYALTDDDEDANDPVLQEALAIARELIITRMAQQGLPPPKGLDLHAKALVDGQPALQDRARARVEARYRAAASAIAEAL